MSPSEAVVRPRPLGLYMDVVTWCMTRGPRFTRGFATFLFVLRIAHVTRHMSYVERNVLLRRANAEATEEMERVIANKTLLQHT
jgi:hypothetical protein